MRTFRGDENKTGKKRLGKNTARVLKQTKAGYVRTEGKATFWHRAEGLAGLSRAPAHQRQVC